MPHRTAAIINTRAESSHRKRTKVRTVATMRAARAHAGKQIHRDHSYSYPNVQRAIPSRPGKCLSSLRRNNSHRANAISHRLSSKLRRISSLSSANNMSSDRHPLRLVRRVNGNAAAANRSIEGRHDKLFLAITRACDDKQRHANVRAHTCSPSIPLRDVDKPPPQQFASADKCPSPPALPTPPSMPRKWGSSIRSVQRSRIRSTTI